MSDDLNGGVPADDTALFASVVEGERPEQIAPEPTPVVQPEAPSAPEPAIPPSRLREEAEARRKAETEVAELRGRLSAMETRLNAPKQEKEQKPAPEPWDAGYTEYVQSRAAEQLEQQYASRLDAIAKDTAIARFTEEKVNAAEMAFMQAMQNRTLDRADYQRVADAPNRYAAAVAWHQNQLVREEVGSDPAAYKAKALENALKDPEFLKRALDAARGQALANGSTIAQPVRPQVQSLPSLSKVGAVALPENGNEVSDADLFASTITRRRA